MPMTWHLETIGHFYTCGEDMAVYFDPASGDTHLVSNFAAHLIQRIAGQECPLTNQQIIELVSADIEPADLAELSGAVPGILSELAALDIVSQV